MLALTLAEWELLLRQARHAGAVGRLGALLDDSGGLDGVPVKAREHLEAAEAVVQQQHRLIRWEVTRIRRALTNTGVDIVLLKGAAYLLAALPPAKGRLFSDLDIMVPKSRLPEVEATLLREGWQLLDMDAYDDHFYRAWSHELPPMRHRDRHIVVDVHHNILPPTGRLHPEAELLLAAARALPGSPLKVLAPTDMVIHSASHLFQSGDLHSGLRDLTDLDALMRHFAAEAGFWELLGSRAVELGLTRPLFYALRFSQRMLGTPIDRQALERAAVWAPAAPLRVIMDFLVTEALAPQSAGEAERRNRLARWLLYVRHHWQRMPPLLLVRHLLRKSLHRRHTAA
jgi:hypothetical protein